MPQLYLIRYKYFRDSSLKFTELSEPWPFQDESRLMKITNTVSEMKRQLECVYRDQEKQKGPNTVTLTLLDESLDYHKIFYRASFSLKQHFSLCRQRQNNNKAHCHYKSIHPLAILPILTGLKRMEPIQPGQVCLLFSLLLLSLSLSLILVVAVVTVVVYIGDLVFSALLL